MILIPILLAFLTWILILRLCNQHKFLNIFEQLALWFATALSLFIFELFLQWIIFNKLSLILPIITFIIVLWVFIYKCNKHKDLRKEIIDSIKHIFANIKFQFFWLRKWQRYVTIGILIYVLFKLFMVFSINLHMPTFDDDAVTWWDMKTKVFAENRSLVLDKSSPEFLWSALERNIFAPLTDTYFLLSHKWDINGLTNIVSALFYFISILILFWILLRKTNLFFAALSWYIFTSLPFVFVHGFGAYWNFIWWIFIFITIFYFIEQILNLNKENTKNKSLIIPIMIMLFLASTIRNESLILIVVSFVATFIINYFTKKGEKINIKLYVMSLIWIIIWYVATKLILMLYPANTSLVMWWTPTPSAIISNLSTNKGLFVAPFQQMFLHPDYNLLYILFVISIILFFKNFKKSNDLILMYFFIIIIILIWISILVLYADLIWILTHFAYIRYSIFLTLFIIYFISMNLYAHKSKELV